MGVGSNMSLILEYLVSPLASIPLLHEISLVITGLSRTQTMPEWPQHVQERPRYAHDSPASPAAAGVRRPAVTHWSPSQPTSPRVHFIIRSSTSPDVTTGQLHIVQELAKEINLTTSGTPCPASCGSHVPPAQGRWREWPSDPPPEEQPQERRTETSVARAKWVRRQQSKSWRAESLKADTKTIKKKIIL